MAKYTVTRACGHEEVVVLFGKIKNRDWRLENVEPSKLCYECYQVELAKRREEENREAAETAKEMQLPELTGSEKQIAWAETIRQKMLADIDEFIYTRVKEDVRNDPQLRMRKSLQDIAHMVKNKPYPGQLPDELKPYHYYLLDAGHSIMCVLETHLAEAQSNMDDYEVPVPIKYMMEKGYRFMDGYVVVEAEYSMEIGLIVDDKYYEY